jgi:HAD superfamily hydrolase (TIGR01509 family)
MQFLGKNIKLVILDLDGTLIASTSLWDEVDKLFFARHGKPLPPHYGKEVAAMGLAKGATYTKETFFPFLSEEEILKEWNDLAKEEYEEKIPLKEGGLELLDYLSSQGVLMAVATTNSPELYLPCLKRLGIDKYFSRILDAKDVPTGKTTSKMYDLLVEHYGVSPDETLVIEDSFTPLTIAHEAGYRTIGVYDPHTTKDIESHKEKADRFAMSLDEVFSFLKEENR